MKRRKVVGLRNKSERFEERYAALVKIKPIGEWSLEELAGKFTSRPELEIVIQRVMDALAETNPNIQRRLDAKGNSEYAYIKPKGGVV